MAKYIKCPRCEINYIKEGEDLCEVCKAELKIGNMELLDEDEYEEDLIPCPICKENFIHPGQDMCDDCRERLARADAEEKDDEWEDKEDEVIDDDNDLSLDQMEDDEFNEDYEEEEEN